MASFARSIILITSMQFYEVPKYNSMTSLPFQINAHSFEYRDRFCPPGLGGTSFQCQPGHKIYLAGINCLIGLSVSANFR